MFIVDLPGLSRCVHERGLPAKPRVPSYGATPASISLAAPAQAYRGFRLSPDDLGASSREMHSRLQRQEPRQSRF